MTKLISAFGTSTPYAYWGFELVGHVLDEWLGGFHRIHCLYVHELRSQWRARGERAVLVTSDRPDSELTKLLLNFDFPSFAFVDAPEDSVAWAIADRGVSAKAALCFCSQYFSCLEPVLTAAKVNVFGPEWHARSVGDFIQELTRTITGEENRALAEKVVAKVFPESPTMLVAEAVRRAAPKWSGPLDQFRALSNDVRQLISNTLIAYKPPFERKPIKSLTWPLELFYSANENNERPDQIVMLGMARFLIWGPYCYVPVGYWRARIEFEVVDCPPDVIIESDILSASTRLALKQGHLPPVGIYEYHLDFEVASTNAPLEIRIRLTKGVIEGRFGLRSVRLERMADQPAEAIARTA
jgi:hypothetical protein